MVPPADKGRRAMRARAVVALLLALAAVGALVYGAADHSRPVMMDLKQSLPGGFGGPDDLGGPGGPGGPPAFAPVYKTITMSESEPDLVREITYAGVTRLPSGEIKRTYVGKPPSLCPT